VTSENQQADAAGHLGVGARLKEPPAEELIRSAFAHEVGDGPILYRGMSLADLAHAVMLCEANLIPAAARAPLMAGLLRLHEIPGEAFPYDPALGDVYTNREHALRAIAPGGDGWIRAGRARRESSTVGYLIATRERLLALAAALLDLLTELLRQAEAHCDALMPDYTYLQKAHPTTLAHYLLTFAAPMLRDCERLRAGYMRINRSPAGGGSVNGSRLPLNRERVAALLGFDGLAVHTRDAMWQPDMPVEVVGLAVALMVNLDRLAEDLYLFATDEFGYVTLADAHSRTSVIMPQKKNPYSLAFVRGTARHMMAALTSVIATNLTPSGQPDNRIFAYGEVPRALDHATRTVRLMAGIVARATFNTGLMASRAAEGFSGATDLGDYLTEAARLDPAAAHRVIGLAIREMREAGEAGVVSAAALDQAARQLLGHPLALDEQAVARVQAPDEIVRSRQGTGGAGAAPAADMIATARHVEREMRDWLDAAQARLEGAELELLAAARSIAASHIP
jgi:argininosuccinate lyase